MFTSSKKNSLVATLLLTLLSTVSLEGVTLKKALTYDSYTLEDTYIYKNQERVFQWDKMGVLLDSIELLHADYAAFAVLENYKNKHGIPPLPSNSQIDKFGSPTDSYMTERNQAIPYYESNEQSKLHRYGRDGTLVAIMKRDSLKTLIKDLFIGQNFWIPNKYLNELGPFLFKKAVVVDIKNQNITTFEREGDGVWLIRSMNPCSTGLFHPPYKRPTPTGIFLVQDRIRKMFYYIDGTTEIGGFAPYASRFCGGSYLHGIPINYPSISEVEYSPTLGTTPRSHRCVRNATSHAKYMYDWLDMAGSLVFVID